IIAAQSIGEPGTQLTMRTFHTGGVASAEDITQGLPRVEELFEARKPKSLAIISEIDGEVRFEEIKNARHAVIYNKETSEEKAYLIPFGFRVKVQEGQQIKKGDKITDGAVNPHDILDILGPEAVMNYLISEVQSTYRLQGVEINDKHIEVIVRQMMRKVRVDDAGDTKFMSGQTYDKNEVLAENEEIKKRIAAGEEGLREATFTQLLLGITKAALATDSFLSAASFQETTRVLTDAAIKGKVDPLVGLKENVCIGKLIPAGTGMRRYANVQLESNAPVVAESEGEAPAEVIETPSVDEETPAFAEE
ncbi:MAG: DNA-directed RNA polymerase subunit beta', partial [Ruminococcus sp.]